MAVDPVPSKQETLRQIDESWTTMQTALQRLTERQLTAVKDAQGWTVQHHLVHIAAWERSVTSLLRGKSRAEGLGVDAALFNSGDVDAVNAAIYRAAIVLTPAEAAEVCRRDHGQLREQVAQLSDSDMGKPCRDYSPSEASDNRPVFQVILDNSAGHYEEHLPWIEALAAGGS
jgi:hypothetical protein